MVFKVTGGDFLKAAFNDVYAIGFFAAGLAASAAVQKIAHAVFSVQKDTRGSAAIKFLSFSAVAITAAYKQPEVALLAFSEEQVVQMYILALITSLALQVTTGKTLYLPLSEGAVIGCMGNPSLVVLTCGGALGGAYFEDSVNNFNNKYRIHYVEYYKHMS